MFELEVKKYYDLLPALEGARFAVLLFFRS